MLVSSNTFDQGAELLNILQHHARSNFIGGAPPWYAQFSNAVYTNIHQAAAGTKTVAQAINSIARNGQLAARQLADAVT